VINSSLHEKKRIIAVPLLLLIKNKSHFEDGPCCSVLLALMCSDHIHSVLGTYSCISSDKLEQIK